MTSTFISDNDGNGEGKGDDEHTKKIRFHFKMCKKCLVFDDRANCEAYFVKIYIYLIKFLAHILFFR